MKTKLITITILLVSVVISCTPDEFTLSGLPKQGPVVASFDVSAVIVPGVPVDLKVNVNGTPTNPVSTVLLEIIKKGSTTAEKSITITPPTTDGDLDGEADNTGVVQVSWLSADSGVDGLPAGDYVLRAKASNANGETTGQTPFTILDVPPVCFQVGMITVVLFTPQSIPENATIGAIGSFAGSGWGTDFPLTVIGNGYYCVTLPLGVGDGFKFRINSSWGTEEKNNDCGGAPDRVAPGHPTGPWPSVTVQNVPKWGGFGC